MTERLQRLARRSGMKRTVLAVLPVGLLALTGCGTTAASPAAHTSSNRVAACAASSAPIRQAKSLGSADLDGHGTAVVRVTGSDTRCANTLFAKLGDRYVWLRLGSVHLEPVGARTIIVPGRPGQVLVARTVSPRGGYQVHLYGVAGGKLGELLTAGHPLVPFVATDTTSAPIRTTCGKLGLQVTTGTLHQGQGKQPEWTFVRTDYTVRGNDASVSGRHVLHNRVPDAQLKAAYPPKVGDATFARCG
ncbi:MAG: hypothetical protein M3Z50_02925 [Actinomycetota bacterium]|nr:hypothetical protein [Actinomycetota bacterium]